MITFNTRLKDIFINLHKFLQHRISYSANYRNEAHTQLRFLTVHFDIHLDIILFYSQVKHFRIQSDPIFKILRKGIKRFY